MDNGPLPAGRSICAIHLERTGAMRENESSVMKSAGRILGLVSMLVAMVTLTVNAELKKSGLPRGLWGGQHISIDVSGKGATVEYDCAHATIDRAIILDRNGRFNVSGTHFQERGGPVRQGGQSGFSVTFSGEVKGKTMTLTVQNTSTKEDLGTFTVVRGAQPKLFKCK
jgi:hypothetical protein